MSRTLTDAPGTRKVLFRKWATEAFNGTRSLDIPGKEALTGKDQRCPRGHFEAQTIAPLKPQCPTAQTEEGEQGNASVTTP